MVSKKDSKFVIWPEYFMIEYTRAEGRLVQKNIAVASPTLDEIAKAAHQLGLNPVIEKEKAYPKKWWKKSGRVLVDAADSKVKIVKQMAEKIKDNRKSMEKPKNT